MRINIFCWFMILFFVLPVCSMAEKMTAGKVIRNYTASYEKQMKGVKDITIVTDKDIIYKKWITVNGKTICKTRHEVVLMGKKLITIYDGVYQWQQNPMLNKVTKEKFDYNPYQMIENLKNIPAKYGGTEKIDGDETHILKVDDITKLISSFKQPNTEGTASNGRFWIDAKDWVIKKIEMYIKDINEKPGKVTIKMKDFRKVDGILIPYCTVAIIDSETMKVSLEQEQELRNGLAEMQKQFEAMPPDQREIAERMMMPQMEMMQKSLGKDGLVIETRTKKVEVNTGLSNDLFDGSKLK